MIALLLLVSGVTASAPVPEAQRRILRSEYEARVYAAWLGQCVGNVYGLPHENAYIDAPGPDAFPYGYTKNIERLRRTGGAFSDDDTDLEYMYLLAMEAHGPEPTYAQLVDRWKRHVRDRVWLANRAALALMRQGIDAPLTGRPDQNPHWFQIDPQLINEVWAVTAPGMVRYASEKSAWAARITSEGFGAEPTVHYGAMYAAAFFERDVAKLVDIGTAALPPGSRFAATVEHMKELHRRYPADWRRARQEMAERYYRDEPADTRTIWNANLNGAAGILALLYGGGDFQKTLDLACAMGFDADNQAATMAGLVALARGLEVIPRELLFPFPDLGWTLPLNDLYKNVTREDMPDASLRDLARRMARQGEAVVLSHGGRLETVDGLEYLVIDAAASFTPPLELPAGPRPLLERGRAVSLEIPVVAPAGEIEWRLASGRLPPGLRLAQGRLQGTPSATGSFAATVSVRQGGREATRRLDLVVRGENLALEASRILATVERTDTAKRDAMWLSVPRSLYAERVDVIKDGVRGGPGSTFYSIGPNDAPHEDAYGYEWTAPQRLGLLAYQSGAVEENGGWFTSLTVDYRDQTGEWRPVTGLRIDPPLPPGNEPFDKAHFQERLLVFDPVTTTAIRIRGDAGGAKHWFSKPTFFTSISELGAYEPLSQDPQ